ncbi:MAG: hypothetical protein GKR89_28195 [Candidatus Latescibacteria bacterium]|nr:hypothetical protein [Candidatus Latescibacterota bacterium]
MKITAIKTFVANASGHTNDPTTWLGPWRPEEETSEAEQNCRVDFTWKYREPAS